MEKAAAFLPELAEKTGLRSQQILTAAEQTADATMDLVERRLCNRDILFQSAD